MGAQVSVPGRQLAAAPDGGGANGGGAALALLPDGRPPAARHGHTDSGAPPRPQETRAGRERPTQVRIFGIVVKENRYFSKDFISAKR